MSRPFPIMLIHGYAGVPAVWIESKFKLALVEVFNLDPDLIHIFNYGLNGRGEYNNRGDIRKIASRLSEREAARPVDLDSQVARLSRKSVDRGGPETVTLIAHSMGGLVARYWMSRRRPDEFGTVFDAPVRRLITIGTPHLGVDLLDVPFRLIRRREPILAVAEFIEALPFLQSKPATALRRIEVTVENMQRHALRDFDPEVAAHGDLHSPALRQMHPGSDFLRRLNRPGNWPAGVDTALIWGDIRFGAALRAGRLLLWERLITVGDLLVSARSASTLPGATATKIPLVDETRWEIDIGRAQEAPATHELDDLLPDEYHANLLEYSAVQDKVGRLLTAGRRS